jgi:hypothetical protein
MIPTEGHGSRAQAEARRRRRITSRPAALNDLELTLHVDLGLTKEFKP